MLGTVMLKKSVSGCHVYICLPVDTYAGASQASIGPCLLLFHGCHHDWLVNLLYLHFKTGTSNYEYEIALFEMMTFLYSSKVHIICRKTL